MGGSWACTNDGETSVALVSIDITPVGDVGLIVEKARSRTMPLSSMEIAQISRSSSGLAPWQTSPNWFVISTFSCGKQVSASSITSRTKRVARCWKTTVLILSSRSAATRFLHGYEYAEASWTRNGLETTTSSTIPSKCDRWSRGGWLASFCWYRT